LVKAGLRPFFVEFLIEEMGEVTERRNLFTIVEYFHKHLGLEDEIMEISIEKATNLDAEAIFDIQVKAFKPLLEKYKDYETNPANENLERVYTRINNPNGGFYKILANNIIVGAICVFWKEDVQFWISQSLYFLNIKVKDSLKKQ
jgi:hypothetical protein